MTSRRSAALLTAGLVTLAAVYVAWLGFRVQTMGDYPNDYAPAMNALLAGHLGAFFAHLPTNGAGASLLLRAPGALLGKLLVGGQHAIFRFGALESMLAVGAVSAYAARRVRGPATPPLAGAALIAVFMLAPAVLDAVFFGHPEEPLGAALCVLAVLLAADGHGAYAGAALGLAIVNKPWGVLAALPVLLAARPAARGRIAVLAAAIGGAWAALAYVADPAHFSRILIGASTSVVAHPVDLWWPLARLHVAPGVMPAYFPPAVVSDHARELAVLLSLPLAIPLARDRRRTLDRCLALLALLFLLRCLLDPSNHVYYQVPLVFALAAWEVTRRRAPVISLAALGGFWLVFHTISGIASLDLQFAAYLVLTLPLVTMLAGPATGRISIATAGESSRSHDRGYRLAA